MPYLQIVNSVDQLIRGQKVVVGPTAASTRRGEEAVVVDFDRWGGDYDIYEAVWIRFADGTHESRSPGSLLRAVK